MKQSNVAGFTIIETMLFLAVTGLLVASMMAGIGLSLNLQRYKDSVETFKSLLQSQYSDLANVQNTNTTGWTCNSSATPVESSGQIKGQSDCLLLGRYITVVGGAVNNYPVLGRAPVSASSTGNDIDKLRAYTLRASTQGVESTTLEWGTQIAWPREGVGRQSPQVPRSIGILFIRSPESGHIFTFTSDTVTAAPTPTTIRDMLVLGGGIPGQGQRTICLDFESLSPLGVRSLTAPAGMDSSIWIAPAATGPSSIEVQNNDFLKERGVTTRC